jgi:hypothetical protein
VSRRSFAARGGGGGDGGGGGLGFIDPLPRPMGATAGRGPPPAGRSELYARQTLTKGIVTKIITIKVITIKVITIKVIIFTRRRTYAVSRART